ncbi:hypothetical protein SOM22_07645 [Stenotrophomonas rhizophila]|uniref:hypothetical protein n=1 Tax=Stenotrophomonas rhizophila TaxID=216778 RepID=UPI002A6B04EB|nr:hypothetical protein [Stenotrophomonas rhizophila]MDY0954445.1 hypothetical protein [Stenotrophomonas rhizophila]
MKAKRRILVALPVLLFAAAQSPAQEAITISDAVIDRELNERELALAAAPIRSRHALERYISEGRLRDSSLQRMPQAARTRFLQSLVFNENGVSSFDYRDIASHLEPMEIYAVLSLFGAQRSAGAIPGFAERATAAGMRWPPEMIEPPVDYPDKVCAAKVSCAVWDGGVCIGSNC